MTEALSTTAVYTITEDPIYLDDDSRQTALRIGQKVKVKASYATPDEDGDVRVIPAEASEGFGWYVRASCLTKDAEVADFPVGTRVRIAADARTSLGGRVNFDHETEGVVDSAGGWNGASKGDVLVTAKTRDGRTLQQEVGVAFLANVEEPEEAPEEAETACDEVAEEPRPADSEVVSVLAIQKAHAFLIDKGDSESTEALIELAKLIEAGV